MSLIVVLLGIIYFTDILSGQASVNASTGGGDTGTDRYIENVAFGPGEKLSFDLDYGFINAGYATMEVVDLIEYNERPCHLIVSTAHSNKFFSSFYNVEDRVESVVDANGIFSWHFEKNQNEGGYHANKSYSFDQVNHVVNYEDSLIQVAAYIQDALSSLYFVRTLPLKVGESVLIDNFTDGKHYPLEVKVLKKETIKVKAGIFDCLVLEPFLQSHGIFRHEGKLKVWVTDDRIKMPVLMKSKVIVGSISAELTAYELGEIVEF